MNRQLLAGFVVVSLGAGVVAAPAFAKKKRTAAPATAPTTAPADSAADDRAYRAAAEKRADKMLKALDLNDPAKEAKVHEVLVNHAVAMNAWQAANQPGGQPLKEVVKDPSRKASLDALHAQFNRDLAAQLTPAQVESVKDQLTVNKVRVTYDAYVQIVPGLTDAEKAHMLDLLKQAREEAIDGHSMEEKSAIFKVYKGKINVYLSGDGHDVAKAYKDWGEAQKARQNPATQPVAAPRQ